MGLKVFISEIEQGKRPEVPKGQGNVSNNKPCKNTEANYMDNWIKVTSPMGGKNYLRKDNIIRFKDVMDSGRNRMHTDIIINDKPEDEVIKLTVKESAEEIAALMSVRCTC